MAVWALGINHTTAPLDLRGRFAFALDQIAPTLHGLRQSLGTTSRHPGVETAIISTCNPPPNLFAGGEGAHGPNPRWVPPPPPASGGAGGLDSMVRGEAQILGQMKDAVRAAETAGPLGTTQ